MRSLTALLVLAFCATLWSGCSTSPVPRDSDKELIMLEIEPIARNDRNKRASTGAGLRFVRQTHSVPPEYLSLLQQLSPQQQQHQQQLIQQLVVGRDGSKQPAAARYVLSQDGRIVQESLGLSAIQQQQGQQQYLIPQQPEDDGRPLLTPELDAFSRAQTQIQQDYHDAPIRAQIAGITERPPQPSGLRSQPIAGPGSPAPQIFSQAANQALARHQARLQNTLQQDPSYSPLQLQGDPNAYYQLLSQQQPQQLSVASADTGRQLTSIYDSAPRTRVVYQAAQAQLQPQPQSQPQAQPAYQPKLPASRRPIGPSSQAQLAPSTQPQLIQPSRQPQLLQSPLIQQDAPQQYLVETTRPASPAGPPQQLRFLDPYSQQDQSQNDALYASLFSNSGRGLFSPAAPEKLSRTSTYAKGSPNQQEKLPTVRIPSSANQRPLSRAELDALVNAGFSITPVGSEEPQASLLKAKRTPLPLPSRNHVIYQNQQDGVSYQYSPGSSAYNPAPKTKRYAPLHELDNVYRAESNRQGIVTYVMALQDQA